ncbi:protein FAM189A1-like isoform X1 [Dendronephthya gigantea]|uniref:protein FAM189A1-like isoform X1 n=1 Tax=Dendronephthya gigantea TaxID=151771 RepID=UPI00106A7C55|nr:protein FAM189A1-like isoform X1 [Dendronephthya gigantea]
MEENPRLLVRSLRRNRSGKLALQTAIIHLCCSVVCIIIGIFSMAIVKSRTIEQVYGLPLWIGLLLLLTGFSGVQCHVKKTKIFAGLYMVLSLLSMFTNLIGIAWMLSTMKKSEVVVICLVCVSTFDMGIACLSTAMGCNILLEDCKICKHHGRGRSADDSPNNTTPLSRPCVELQQDTDRQDSQENVHVSTRPTRQARYTRPRPGDEPPPYSEVLGPPPPYSPPSTIV